MVLRAEGHPLDAHTAELGRRRKQPEGGCGHVAGGGVDVKAGDHVLQQLHRVITGSLLAAQVVDALGRGHQQRARPASGVDEPPSAEIVGQVAGADGQSGQQGRRGGTGVVRAVVAGGVQQPVEDAPQQVVAGPGGVSSGPQGAAGDSADAVSPSGVLGGSVQDPASRLEDGAVVQREDHLPSGVQVAHHVLAGNASDELPRGPLSSICAAGAGVGAGSRLAGQVLVETSVKH